MTQRKWLAECHAWLDDPTSVQYLHPDKNCWNSPQGVLTPIGFSDLTWRLKPKTITINGEELVAPVPPHQADQYHINFATENEDHCRCFWFNTREDRDAVYSKLCEVLGS